MSIRGKRGDGAASSASVGVPPQRSASRLPGGVGDADRGEHLRRDLGHDGQQAGGHDPHRFEPDPQDAGELRGGPLGLDQLPGLVADDVLVGLREQPPEALERPAEGEVPHRRLVVRHHLPGGHRQDVVAAGIGGRPAAEGAAREGHQPAHGVAEVVRQVAVVAVDERLVREVGVLAEDHLAQQEVAHAVAAEAVDQLVGAHDVAGRFRHLAAVALPPAVRPDRGRQRQAGRHQEGRPVDGVEAQDVLPHQVQPDVPMLPELLVERRPPPRRSRGR